MNFIQTLWSSFSHWAMGWGGLAALVGLCLLALWYFTPPFLSSQEARAFLLNIGLGCVAFAFLSAYFLGQGYSICVADFAKRDKTAVERKEQGETDINLCRASGRDWDVVTGTCMEKPQ